MKTYTVQPVRITREFADFDHVAESYEDAVALSSVPGR